MRGSEYLPLNTGLSITRRAAVRIIGDQEENILLLQPIRPQLRTAHGQSASKLFLPATFQLEKNRTQREIIVRSCRSCPRLPLAIPSRFLHRPQKCEGGLLWQFFC